MALNKRGELADQESAENNIDEDSITNQGMGGPVKKTYKVSIMGDVIHSTLSPEEVARLVVKGYSVNEPDIDGGITDQQFNPKPTAEMSLKEYE